ncbi:Na+ channel auxiliary subunit TipE [Cinara cedri]|uniref:Na+ channel auxiliary subunit TipE n=1 Tax=Cinara cedri TaxID=506608 RepID=A0A5E4MPB7_9HEMI|nr:Na+ channel auxiliary subunit TipE [Cinara cedri]
MDDEPDEETTNEEKKEAERKRQEELREKVLFYLTTFFILLAIVSLFVFLFLVPFLIEPAITTIFMEFDETPTTCVTAFSEVREGASNCSQPGGWASCREGCTREIYECVQILVNYTVHGDRAKDLNARHRRSLLVRGFQPIEPEPATWAYSYARIYPNVKGCGYPPHLNCSVFKNMYFDVGASYPCYYSRVEPWVVITELDLAKSIRQLIYSMVFPIPCFVVSVVYVTLAYFCIYAGRNRKPKMKRRIVRRMVMGGAGGGSTSRAKTGSEVTPLTVNNSGVPFSQQQQQYRRQQQQQHHYRGSSEEARGGGVSGGVVGGGGGGTTGTPGNELLYRDDDDDDEDDDDASSAYYGEQLRSTLAVDDSSADYVNTLRMSEHTLRQSDSNEPSREWSEDEVVSASESPDPSVKAVSTSSATAAAAPFPDNSPTGNLTKTMTTCILTPPGPTAEV